MKANLDVVYLSKQYDKMHFSTWQTNSFCAIILILFLKIVATQIVSQEVPKPWYENLPAVAMDYKVII